MLQIKNFASADAGYNNAEKIMLEQAESAKTQKMKDIYLRTANRFAQLKRIPIGYWYSKYEVELPFPKENSIQISLMHKNALIEYLKK